MVTPTGHLTERRKKEKTKRRESKEGARYSYPTSKERLKSWLESPRIFKRYDLETVHKPSTKLKNILCNKMKDEVHPLDKTGAVYYNDCLKHLDPKNDYVGETDRVNRERQYEHGIIDHKTSKRSASLSYEEQQTEPSTTTTTNRRSTRNKKKIDYKTMQTGSNQRLTEGNTEFSAHVASDIHDRKDLRTTVLCTDDNWYRRGIKEAIAIRKIKSTLNKDDGRHHLSRIYDGLIRSSVQLKTPRPREPEASEERHF